MSNYNLNSLIYGRKGNHNSEYTDRLNGKTFDDGISIMALADGVNSCAKSKIGAEIVTETAIETLHDLIILCKGKIPSQEVISGVLLTNINTEIEKKAQEEGFRKEDYASTLLFMAVVGDKVVAGQIGDGYIVVKSENKKREVLFEPKDDELEIDNITRTFLDEPRFMQVKVMDKAKVKNICLLSEGTDSARFTNGNGTTPFVTSKLKGRKTNSFFFEMMDKALEDSGRGRIEFSKYFKNTLDGFYDVLSNNLSSNDMTIAMIDPNEEGKLRKLKSLFEIIYKKYQRGAKFDIVMGEYVTREFNMDLDF